MQHVPLPRQGRHLTTELGQRVDDRSLLDRLGRLSSLDGVVGLRDDGLDGLVSLNSLHVVGGGRGEDLGVVGGGLRGDVLRHGVPAFQWRETRGGNGLREGQRQ